MSKPVKRQTHCFAPGCSTGYVSARKASVKKSVFAVPSSEDRLKEWRRAVPRADKILDQTSVLCESHFEERFILRDYTHIVNGEVVKIPRGRPCLTEDAIPTIFPNTPSYLSKKLPQKRHSRTSRGEVLGKKRKTNDENEPPMEHDSALDATADGAPVIGACTVERLDYLQGEMLPNKYWCRCLLVDAPKAVAFTVCSQAGDSLSFQKLVLCSAEDTRYHCSVFVQGVTVKKVEVFDAESVKSLLHSVNEMIVCSGFEQSAVPLEQRNFSQILGVFGSHGNVKGDMLAKIITDATLAAEKSGLYVDFVTTDGASWNRSMWRQFGIKGTSKSVVCKVKHPADHTRSLHFLSDFPHLVKCARNSVVSTGLQVPEGRVRLDVVKEAWKCDNRDIVRLKIMPRVTRVVIEPNGFEKMKVNFAFTFFSDEIVRGLYAYREEIERIYGSGSSEATVSFIRRMAKLIAAMTSRCSRDAMRPSSLVLAEVEDFIAYLDAWEEEVGKLGFLSQATAEGLRVTLASTVSILEYVTGKLGYQYLLTSRLSQDPLENVFGILRQMSGSNDHPTPTQFLLSANCLSFCSLAKAPANGNVSPAMLQSLIRGCNKDRREVEKKLDELMDVGCLSEVHEILTSSGIQMDHGAMVSAKSDSRDIRVAFEPYGELTDVNRERWCVSGVSEKGSTTRVLSLKLKAGVTIEDVPHQVRVAGELALVVIPGKASLCLRCQGKGHIRRDCRIPRCQRCRRFGHDETQCVPTYANITGPTTNKKASENFMDEVEAEEAAATAPEKPKKPEPPPCATEKRVSITSHQKNSEEAPEESKVEALQGNATENCVVEAAAPCDPSKDGSEAMEGIVSMSAKRGHGDTVNDSDLPKDASGGPPPPKSALTRRMSFKPKPNIPPDGRPEAKPPN
ncbi:hypothetical protein HPB50_015784 [Hyalomma asiaticum]|uniref:Uncharacterized protein n=1 Tax=Hyalomma asiaticum TaxID=266040 RepID=A0ACB7RTC2_HYAAI|nr:hypothetical protein HPB50_015784 [Hyalomma asiaticum]